MPSQARQALDDRLRDVEQLLQAHEALTKFRKAAAAANQTGTGLRNIFNVVHALVTQPGQGRPAEVSAINRSAFVLLTAHFQGFIEDLHLEAAQYTLAGKVASVQAVVNLVKPRNSNPHVDIIEKMFSGIGIYDLMQVPRWQRCSNANVQTRVTNYIRDRNLIAHGNRPTIRKQKVTSYKDFVARLADALDVEVGRQIHALTGIVPW